MKNHSKIGNMIQSHSHLNCKVLYVYFDIFQFQFPREEFHILMIYANVCTQIHTTISKLNSFSRYYLKSSIFICEKVTMFNSIRFLLPGTTVILFRNCACFDSTLRVIVSKPWVLKCVYPNSLPTKENKTQHYDLN